MRYALALAFGLVAVLNNAPATAQFPNRLVKIIVPFASGGANDVVGRAIADRLSVKWGKPVIVENRAGAATAIGTRAVIEAPADGHTLLFTSNTALVVNPHLTIQKFNALEQLEPVAMVVKVTPALAVSKDTPAKNLTELLAYAKSNPKKLNYASLGVGSYTHVGFEYLQKAAGVELLHVPYNGTSPVLIDMRGGRINMFMVAVNVFEEFETSGDLRVLAVATRDKLARRPDLPTISETIPGFDLDVWFGLAAPKNTPSDVMDQIQKDVSEIVGSEAFAKSFLIPQGYEASNLDRQGFQAKVSSDYVAWGKMIEAAGLLPAPK